MEKIFAVVPPWAAGVGFLLLILVVFIIQFYKEIKKINNENEKRIRQVKEENEKRLNQIKEENKKNLEISREITRLEFKVKLSEQMKYVESKISGIIRKNRDHFTMLIIGISKMTIQECENTEEYKKWDRIIFELIRINKYILRRNFKEINESDEYKLDHRPSINEIEALSIKYAEDSIKDAIKESQKIIRNAYCENPYFTKEQLDAELYRGVEHNNMFMRDFYKQGFLIHFHNEDKIKQLNEKIRPKDCQYEIP